MESLINDPEWQKAMRLEYSTYCYSCEQDIAAGTLPYPMQPDGYGFVWGSDGFYPNGASAMYACFDCRAFWIDRDDEDEEL